MSIINQNAELFGEDIPWLEGLRQKARLVWSQTGFPNAKTEAWKYSYFTENCLDNPVADTTPHNCDGYCRESESLPFSATQIKYCNGKLTNISEDLPRGLIIRPLYEAIAEGEVKSYLNKSMDMEQFPFAALNTAFLDEGVLIIITRDTVLDKPLYIHSHQHAGMNRMSNIRNLIVCEKGASATLIEHYDGDEDAKYFNNVVNEIYLSTGSCLTHYKWQHEAASAHHVALNGITVKADGKYTGFVAHNECAMARSESYVRLLQEQASARINGVYRLKTGGVSDITTNIRHLAPHTASDQLVKGVLDGASRGVFQGQIHIAPDAQQTAGYQLHRALVLSDAAEVDCKPELEIFADDVKCSHGATSGDLDAEQMFYLQSRGIKSAEAKQILIDAYLGEVLNTIDNEEIAAWLKSGF